VGIQIVHALLCSLKLGFLYILSWQAAKGAILPIYDSVCIHNVSQHAGSEDDQESGILD